MKQSGREGRSRPCIMIYENYDDTRTAKGSIPFLLFGCGGNQRAGSPRTLRASTLTMDDMESVSPNTLGRTALSSICSAALRFPLFLPSPAAAVGTVTVTVERV